MFFSPIKIQEARDLQADREAQKEVEQAAKQVTKEQKEHEKALKVQNAAQKKQQLQKQRAEQVATKAIKKAQKEAVKNTSKADKQLNSEHQQLLKKPKRQNNLTIAPLPPPIFHEVGIDQRQPSPTSSRPQRTKRALQRFKE